ncbi:MULTISPECIES: P-type DNA transfer ATPase VirB11 [unclassified Brevundimonas]|uniref:P-type DNA transfer ATPase VirB11 n=1 Tax=unclassified Brevundimonas TaxID=2622653 RepID=UPI000CFBD9E3|nr:MULTISPECIES: P-type DNA transfer ATPase VirB11 [unclassified Brevundimonas]PRA27670.1 P-type DNA transfer ATPase VirB11 [Brevundimonas sp. MYb27]PQZ74966.1 P-type DNA transfer ATPase VirB11 [Brevundimonas sp. MYb31]PRB17612.1 P-type DNA transfer ATPase VirB11 [Brevundimonas sp. MYb52]PRB37984.1 P-type DNA transfer ATPase VirB11 [Brevundimonas sp. MYb46]PRB45386.1 P-type DNA transfer ATPase VirB11 [Brevundimonas sp. MYb33]
MEDTSVLDHYLAPLRPFLVPDAVTEVVINRPGEVGVEAGGQWRWHEVADLSEAWLRTLAVAAAAFTRQDVDAEHPICSTILTGNERCQIVLPPAVPSGAVSLTIRKPSRRRMGLEDFEAAGLFAAATAVRGDEVDPTDTALTALRQAGDWPGFFRLAVESRRNILISGATGSGKTTFAKGLVELIPAHERLLTIEDTRELVVPHRNAVHLLYAKDGQGPAKIGPKALLESALRMRPDRILLQELRDGAAAFFFLRTVNSGHPGSITTVHADSAALAFEQLTLLVRESEGGRDLPRDDIRSLLHLMVDVVVQMKKVDGCFQMTEVWHDPARKRLARG